ncbi:Gfo/Idh/MocA family protein [Rhodohalobacter sp. 614A]|uniref:Gfo/Idh/MocA family protein n=1 Tax=Rhodohalobacter sp. 614A TaxID=2908649 RepID=UPI001F2AF64B|nr:Gfo/Idh/MocA family oxidoreductase [Rhodohalobacter sp. 614A]
MTDKQVNIAIVGLGFGAEFIPIYQRHPNANMYAISQRTESQLHKIGDQFGIENRYTSYEQMLEDPEIDAVHINTPIQLHAKHSLMALRAGKHVSCTVPMATTIEECEEIVDTVKLTGLKYTMAETVVYSREFLFVKELYEKGELGEIQYLQASHPQDMEGWPEYWERMKPMHYATHVVSPVLGLMNKPAEYVSCFGSGKISEELAEKSGCSFAVQSAHIKLKGSDVSAHIYRSLFDTARQYRESFDAYGSKKSYEWPLIEGEKPVIHTAKKPEPEIAERVEVPDYGHRLPEEIQAFTQAGVYDAEDSAHLSFIQGGGHGGSHPHLAHEFVSAIIEDRDPYPNAVQSANWTCVGLLAHESSMSGGEIKKLPEFTLG